MAAMVALRDQLQGQNLELAAVCARDRAGREEDLRLRQRRVQHPLLLGDLPHVHLSIGSQSTWSAILILVAPC